MVASRTDRSTWGSRGRPGPAASTGWSPDPFTSPDNTGAGYPWSQNSYGVTRNSSRAGGGSGLSSGYVPKHHRAPRPRAGRHRGGDRGGRPSVRAEGERGAEAVRRHPRALRAGG